MRAVQLFTSLKRVGQHLPTPLAAINEQLIAALKSMLPFFFFSFFGVCVCVSVGVGEGEGVLCNKSSFLNKATAAHYFMVKIPTPNTQCLITAMSAAATQQLMIMKSRSAKADAASGWCVKIRLIRHRAEQCLCHGAGGGGKPVAGG